MNQTLATPSQGPVGADALEGEGQIGGLLPEADPPVARLGAFRGGVPVQFAEPNRFVGVAVGDHKVANVLRSAEVDDARVHAAVGRARPEAVALCRHHVEVRGGAGVVHPLEEEQVGEVAATDCGAVEVDGGGERAGDDDGLGVGGANCGRPSLEQICIGLGVGGVYAPFGIDIRFVPDLIVADSAAIAFGDRGGEIGVVLEIVGRAVGARRRCPVRGSRPAGWRGARSVRCRTVRPAATMWSYFSQAERAGSLRRSSKSPLAWISIVLPGKLLAPAR